MNWGNCGREKTLVSRWKGEGEVTLKGTVRSLAEREEAERAASIAPGVSEVVNNITVGS